ncbi:MAG: uroporphyrinogen-III synthase [Cellvibrionales bacterium]|nr:uroporphyrinogen-III synthase [Cellvibrionales bacterium]
MTISNLKMRVLVTRPAGQADRLVDVLEDAGITVSCLPLLHLKAVTEAEKIAAIKKQLLLLSQQDFVIFISSNAVKYTAEFLAQHDLKWPSSLPCIPIGGATAKAIEDLGWLLDRVDECINGRINKCDTESSNEEEKKLSAYSSEKLLVELSQRDVGEKRITIFRGEGGRELLADNLTSRGASVAYCEMYKRQHPNYSSEQFEQALGQNLAAILFASGETLENFYRHIQRDELQVMVEDVPMIVPSERIKNLAEHKGFNNILIAVNASAEGFLQVITQQLLK